MWIPQTKVIFQGHLVRKIVILNYRYFICRLLQHISSEGFAEKVTLNSMTHTFRSTSLWGSIIISESMNRKLDFCSRWKGMCEHICAHTFTLLNKHRTGGNIKNTEERTCPTLFSRYWDSWVKRSWLLMRNFLS